MKTYSTSNELLLKSVKEKLGVTKDIELADMLGVPKQSIHQFKKGESKDVVTRMLAAVVALP